MAQALSFSFCSRRRSSSSRGGKFSSRMPKREPHLVQDLLDLVERLAAEVLGLEHLLLGPLHQLADVLDVGVLQAVRRAHRELELVDRAEEVLVERLGGRRRRRLGSPALPRS